MKLSRREFLVRSGWIAGGLTVLTACSLGPPLPTFGESTTEDTLTWVALRPDGQVHFLLPRAEMGQGISTGLSLIVAQELALPLSRIDCQYQDTAAMAPCQMTVGSQSIENYAVLTARAAAGLRSTLIRRASEQSGVPEDQLQLREGGIIEASGRLIPFADLVADEIVEIEEHDLEALPLLSEEVGTPGKILVRIDELVTGAELYSSDIRLEGMCYGALARPPQIGAVRTGFNREAAAAIPGVEAVVDGPGGELGVVARTPMAARRGVEALQVQWAPLTSAQLREVHRNLDIDSMAGEMDHHPIDEGSIESGRVTASVSLSLRYDSPMVAHAAMEPRAGVARWDPQNGHCTIWTGSQDPWLVRAAALKALGVGSDDVTVRNCRIGGGFGGRLLCQASVEAAWLSRGAGKAVKVQWSREEEFRYNYVGPQFSTRIDAGVNSEGEITFWDHRMVGSPILTTSTLIPPGLHWAADLVADPGTQRGTETPYRFANHRVAFADVRLPVHTGAWRGLGAAPNTFAVECAMDELAEAAGMDPLEFRLRHVASPRLGQVIRRLRVMMPDDPAIGVAVAAYKGVTFVAVAAKVDYTVDGWRVAGLWCVHDCGRMYSPDQVRAQIEGNLVWGIGMAMLERFEVREGIAATDNFDSYVLPGNSDVPDLVIETLESAEPSSGAGEAAFAPAAAAIANAAYRSTGVRQRRLPLDAKVVNAA